MAFDYIEVPRSPAERMELVSRMIEDGRLTAAQAKRFLGSYLTKRVPADEAGRWGLWLADFTRRMGPEEFDSGLARVLWGMGLTTREAVYDLRCQAIQRRLAQERAKKFVDDVMKARGWKPTVQNGVWVGGAS